MPVRARKLCIGKLREILEKEVEQANKGSSSSPSKSKVYKPGVNTSSIPKVQKSSAGLRKR